MRDDMPLPLSRVEIERYRKPRKRDGWEIDLLARTALHYLDRLIEAERERDEANEIAAHNAKANFQLYGELRETEARLASGRLLTPDDEKTLREAGDVLVTLARRNLLRYGHPLAEHTLICGCDHCEAVRGWYAALAVFGSGEETTKEERGA